MNRNILLAARRAPFLAMTALVFISMAGAVLVRKGIELAEATDTKPVPIAVVAAHVVVNCFRTVI